MALSQLATEIYEVLRAYANSANGEITYQELVMALGPLPPPNQDLHWRDSRLDEALGELVTTCRGHQLPALSAIVVRANERSPGAAYFPIAHPQEFAIGGEVAAMRAWEAEVRRIRVASYPERLE